jgi:hypothetical protein
MFSMARPTLCRSSIVSLAAHSGRHIIVGLCGASLLFFIVRTRALISTAHPDGCNLRRGAELF